MSGIEDKDKEYKSLRKAIGRQADLKSLAETCINCKRKKNSFRTLGRQIAVEPRR